MAAPLVEIYDICTCTDDRPLIRTLSLDEEKQRPQDWPQRRGHTNEGAVAAKLDPLLLKEVINMRHRRPPNIAWTYRSFELASVHRRRLEQMGIEEHGRGESHRP